MFRPIPPPVSAFQGYTVRAYRQGRSNAPLRTLREPCIHFAPQFGRVGIFLPHTAPELGEAALREAWLAAGSPPPHPLGPNEALLFGRVLPLRVLPFSGYDDLWLDETQGALCCACRRQPDPRRQAAALADFQAKVLLARAQALLDAWAPRLDRRPARLVIRTTSPRILGQCTREGEIRLAPKLIAWPEAILAETLAHELTHLSHFNHSPAFWRELSRLLPDWLPRSLVHYLA